MDHTIPEGTGPNRDVQVHTKPTISHTRIDIIIHTRKCKDAHRHTCSIHAHTLPHIIYNTKTLYIFKYIYIYTQMFVYTM